MQAGGRRAILTEVLGVSVYIDPDSRQSPFRRYSLSRKIESFQERIHGQEMAIAVPELPCPRLPCPLFLAAHPA